MADFSIKGVIEIILAGKGPEQAAKALREIEAEAKRTRTALEGTAASSDHLGESLKDAVGTEAADSLKETSDSAKETDETFQHLGDASESNLARLNAALRESGQASKENVDLIRDFTKGMEDAGGMTRAETVPAITEFVKVTRSVPAALGATQLASELATEANVSFKNSSQAVAAVLRGDMIAAAEKLGISLRHSTGEMRSQESVLRELSIGFGDLKQRASTAEAGIVGVGVASKGAAVGVTTLSTAIKALLLPLLPLIALVTLFQKLKAAVTDFADEQRSIGALNIQLKALGIEGGASLEQVRAKLLAIQRDGGPAIAETLPVFQKFVTLTKDVNQALELTALASRISETGLLDAGEAGEALIGIFQGRLKPSATALGIAFKDGATQADILRAAFEQYGEAVGEIDDTRNALDKTKASVGLLFREFSTLLAPALDLIAGKLLPFIVHRLTDVVTGIRVVSGVFQDFVKLGTAGLITFAKGLAVAFDFKKLLADPKAYFASLERFQQETAARFGKVWTDAVERQRTIVVQGAKDTAEAEAKAREGLTDKALANELRRRVDAARKQETEALRAQLAVAEEGSSRHLELQKRLLKLEHDQAIVDAIEKNEDLAAVSRRFEAEREVAERAHAQKVREIRQSVEAEGLKAKVEAQPEGTEGRLNAELALLAQQRRAAVENAEETGASVEQTEKIWQQRRANLIADFNRERVEAERAVQEQLLEAQIAATAEGSDKRLTLELQLLELRRTATLAEEGKTEQARRQINATFDQEAETKRREFLEQQTALAIEAERELLTARLALAEEGSDEELRLRQRLLDLDYQARIAAEEKAGRDTLGLRMAWAMEGEALATGFLRARAEAELTAAQDSADAESALRVANAELQLSKLSEIDKRRHEIHLQLIEQAGQSEIEALERQRDIELLGFEKNEAKRLEIIQKYEKLVAAARSGTEKATVELSRKTTEQRRSDAFAIATQSVALARAAFGENKAIAIAETIINTARAVMEAAPLIPLMALMAATGAVQIAKILSTNIGGSGGASGKGAKDDGKLTFAEGGHVRRATASHGASGLVRGPGTETSDQVATLTEDGREVRLSRDEFIVKGRAVKRRGILRLLDLINREQLPEPEVEPISRAEGGSLAEAPARASFVSRAASAFRRAVLPTTKTEPKSREAASAARTSTVAARLPEPSRPLARAEGGSLDGRVVLRRDSAGKLRRVHDGRLRDEPASAAAVENQAAEPIASLARSTESPLRRATGGPIAREDNTPRTIARSVPTTARVPASVTGTTETPLRRDVGGSLDRGADRIRLSRPQAAAVEQIVGASQDRAAMEALPSFGGRPRIAPPTPAVQAARALGESIPNIGSALGARAATTVQAANSPAPIVHHYDQRDQSDRRDQRDQSENLTLSPRGLTILGKYSDAKSGIRQLHKFERRLDEGKIR